MQIFTHTFTLVLLPCTAPAAGTTSLADFLQKKALYLETRASFPLASALIPSALSHLKFYFLNIIQCYRRWQTFRLNLNKAIIIRQPPCKATLRLASHTFTKPTNITFIAQRSQKLHALGQMPFFYYFTVL